MKSNKLFFVGDIVEWSGGNICNGKYGVISIGPSGELCVLDNEGAPDMDVAGHEHELTVVGNRWGQPELLKIFGDQDGCMKEIQYPLLPYPFRGMPARGVTDPAAKREEPDRVCECEDAYTAKGCAAVCPGIEASWKYCPWCGGKVNRVTADKGKVQQLVVCSGVGSDCPSFCEHRTPHAACKIQDKPGAFVCTEKTGCGRMRKSVQCLSLNDYHSMPNDSLDRKMENKI